MECPICSDVLVEEETVLLPCMHPICLHCKQDLLNEGDKETHCFYLNCKTVFVPNKTVFFGSQMKKARLCEEDNGENRHLSLSPVPSSIDQKNTINYMLENAKHEIERIEPILNNEDNIKSLFLFLEAATNVMDKKIDYYQRKKEQLKKNAAEYINSHSKATEILKSNILDLKTRIEFLEKVPATIESETFHPPNEFIGHITRQSCKVYERTYDLHAEVKHLPLFSSSLVATVNGSDAWIETGTEAEIYGIGDLPLKTPILKTQLNKKDLFGDEWETAEWQWINPFGIVYWNYNAKSVDVLVWDAVGVNRVDYKIVEWENDISSYTINTLKTLSFIGKHANFDIRHPNAVVSVNNHPFPPIVIYFNPKSIALHDGIMINYGYSPASNRIHFYHNMLPNIMQDVAEDNLLFFATPNLNKLLVYDKTTGFAYPLNHNIHSFVGLQDFQHDFVAAFTSFDLRHIFVFLATNAHFVHIVTIGDYKFVTKFLRPQELGTAPIIRVVLISETSYLVETKDKIFIY